MRSDLERAIEEMPPRARRQLRDRKHRKILAWIDESASVDETIEAVVCVLPEKQVGEIGGDHLSLNNLGGQILLVTSEAVYHLEGKVFAKPLAIRIPLGRIFDEPRTIARRSLLSFGQKTRSLAIDEQRGGDVQTHVFFVEGEDEALDWIAGKITERVLRLHDEVAEEEASEARNIARAGLSAADEIAKLVQLRDDGILTEQQFEDHKLRLLA